MIFLPLEMEPLKFLRNGKTETCYDILNRGRYLLQVDHVGFCKNTAPAGDPRRFLRFKRKVAEFFYGESEPFGLLVQKRSCSGSTDGIHRKVSDRAAVSIQENKFGIFPPISIIVFISGNRLCVAYA